MFATLLFASLGDFVLDSGQRILDLKVGYRTFGKLDEQKSNVVLFPSWFNGKSADLVTYIGPGRYVDDTKFYVIAMDNIANGVSTSPSNSEKQKAQTFPRITMRDTVRVQHALLGKLGIRKGFAVLGISMSAMQVYQWAASYPDFFEKAVPIVGTPKMSEKDIALWTTFVRGMGRDGAAGGGLPLPRDPRSILDLLQRVPWRRIPGMSPEAREQLGQIFNAGGLSIDIDPLDALRQFEAITGHDVSLSFGRSLDRAAKASRTQMLAVVARTDQAISPETPLEFAKTRGDRVMTLDSPCGHAAFKCEREAISREVQQFLDSRQR
ncbi:MAG: alpha/beta fold hydrolase [Bryobacteraceae bacterium]|nr:alpha/beta fold hydrolase [Bryobacteraceae bacterium]